MAKRSKRRSRRSSEDKSESERASRSRRNAEPESAEPMLPGPTGMSEMGTPMPTAGASISLGPKAKARAEEVRARIANRPDEIPDDNNRQNLASHKRNWDAHEAAGLAGDAGVPETVREVISSSGHSLDASIQRAVEERMGDSFSDVRIHTGPEAANACEDINARAFAVGNHIAFNAGEYAPESAEGQHLLAHELAHVRQQTGGANGVRAAGVASGRNAVTTREPGAAISMMPQEGTDLEIDPDPQLEREAEETAQRVIEGGELGIQRLAGTDVYIQRSPKGDSSQIFTVERDGETKVLKQGSKSKGWKHITGRHINGTLNPNKPTSFFPIGQTIDRSDGSRTLDSIMSKTDIKSSIKRAIERGSTDPSDPADVYILKSNDHSFDLGDIRVIAGMDGDIITAYPVEGPRTPVWKPNSGCENV